MHAGSFKNLRSKSAGAVNFLGGNADLTIFRCLFADNVAFISGGAVVFKGLELSIIDSVFSGNAIQPPDGGITSVPVYVRLHTGSSGLDASGAAQTSSNAGFPVWKMDGEEPITVCNGICNVDALWVANIPHSATDGGYINCPSNNWAVEPDNWEPTLSGEMQSQCTDGQIPGNETIYGSAEQGYYTQASDYAEVLYLGPGPHKLWYGYESHTSDMTSGLRGGESINMATTKLGRWFISLLSLLVQVY